MQWLQLIVDIAMYHQLEQATILIGSKTYPIIQCPSNVLQITVIQEHARVILHPNANFCSTNASNLSLGIPEE
jgi:hypothetical protein